MPKVDPNTLAPSKVGSDYPPPYDQASSGRVIRDLSAAVGAVDWTANHVVVPPGGWSSQRHWHSGEDEIVVVLSGEALLVDDDGRTPMRTGDIAIFRAGDGNGHHLVNEGGAPFTILALSRPERSLVSYPDIDLLWSPETGDTRRDGTPY
jgi:uncharacterized cupin superfamily protein